MLIKRMKEVVEIKDLRIGGECEVKGRIGGVEDEDEQGYLVGGGYSFSRML